jgi:hypothetical protein
MHRAPHCMLLAALLSVPLIGAPTLADSNTGPSRMAVFASIDDVTIGFGPGAQSVLFATITKGKKHRVLTVESMLSIYSAAGPASLLMVPLVNGIPLNPVSKAAAQLCTTGAQCSVTGVWWLDLDAAEAANPGVVIGKPLNVSLVGNDSAQTGSVGSMVLRVRLEKK